MEAKEQQAAYNRAYRAQHADRLKAKRDLWYAEHRASEIALWCAG